MNRIFYQVTKQRHLGGRKYEFRISLNTYNSVKEFNVVWNPNFLGLKRV